jgi:hypothetical protein
MQWWLGVIPQASGLTCLALCDARQIHEEDVTQQERLLFLQFQTTTIGRIKPVPAREAAIRAKRTPKVNELPA